MAGRHWRAGLLIFCLASTGCAAIVGKVTGSLATDLSAAILDSEDPATIRAGAPAYLIILDALLRRGGGSASLLRSAAALNSAYASAFVSERQRLLGFTDKAFNLAQRAACIDIKWTCAVRTIGFEELERHAAALRVRDVPAAYALATTWASWIQARAEDWNAVADLGRVKPIMARVVELDEAHDHGGPHLYMGVFETVLPPSVGGRPELARDHFQRAIELSDGNHLLAKVLFAEHYARLVFDRDLHDQLLREVVAGNPRVEGLTLMNSIAQEQARVLLESADEYF